MSLIFAKMPKLLHGFKILPIVSFFFGIFFPIFLISVKAEDTVQVDWENLIGTNITLTDIDSSGNVFVTGTCKGTIDFNPSALTDSQVCTSSSSSTNKAIYISKYDNNGFYQWTRVMPSTVSDFMIYDIDTDSLGGVVVGGSFTGTVDFDATSGVASKTTSDLYDEVYIVKYLSNGSFGWVRTWGTTASNDNLTTIQIDSNDNVFISGSYESTTIDIDGTSGTTNISKPTGASSGAYLSKYNSSGAFLFGKGWGGSSGSNGVTSMKLDSNGNVFLAGGFVGTNVDFNFDAGTDIKNSVGDYDIFLMKVSNTGVYQWTKTGFSSSADSVLNLLVDINNDVLLNGKYTGTANVDFDPSANTDILPGPGASTSWAFFSKYSNSGTYIWTKYQKVQEFLNGYNLTSDGLGNYYSYGKFGYVSVDFSTDHSFTDIRTTVGSNNYDLYITKILNNGSYGWTKTIGGTANETVGGIIGNSLGDVFITGTYASTSIDINPSASLEKTLTRLGSQDSFILRLDINGDFQGGSGHGGATYNSASREFDGIKLYGNNTIIYINYVGGSFSVSKTTFITGAVVQNVPANTSFTVAGTSTDVSTTGVSGLQTIEAVSTETNTIIAAIPLEFTTNIDLSGLSLGSESTKSFVHVAGGIENLPGVPDGGTYTLFIFKGDGDKVWICPGASSLEGVSLYCSGGYYLSEGQTYNGATASVEAVGGTVYWKVDGLTGTGGMSVVTGLKDTLSRLQTGVGSDHTITFGTNNGLTASGQFLVLAFDPSGYGFDLSSLTISDIVLTDNVGNDRTLASSSGVNTWGVEIDSNLDTITFFSPTSGTGYYPAASQIVIKIGTNAGGINQIINPSTTGSYQETIYILNTDIEGGSVQLPIIDSDRVHITGYVTAYMHFDIDTGVGEVPGINPAVDCNYDTCLIHQNGGAGSNYTVDLGELTSAVVNKSNTTSVAHTSGGNGIINSIYFDISTNAPSGAVVTVKSANGGLQGPGTNMIPSIGVSVGADGVTRADGEDIPANSGVYGYNLPVASSQLHGSIIPNSLCDSAVKYCGPATTPKTVFTTNSLPVDTARVRMDLAAAANYTNNPGLYTDTLTFLAVSTF